MKKTLKILKNEYWWGGSCMQGEYMPFDDQATFRTLLRSDDLTGVYGWNPHTVLQEYLQQAKPQFEDLISLCDDNLPAHYVFLHRRYNIANKTKFASEIKSILSKL